MERNKIIASVFFQYEKRTLLILSIVFLFNLIFNLLAFLFVDSLSLPFFIGQAVGNLFFFAFMYIMLMGLIQVITIIPFLVSLNAPRSILARIVTFNGLKRVSIVTVLYFLVKLIHNRAGVFTMPIILGIDLNSGRLSDDLLLALIAFLILSVSYNFISFFLLAGNRYGWQYLLGIIFIAVGGIFFLIKQLVLLFLFGWQLNVWILLLAVLLPVFTIINYRFIRNFEYKY